MCERNETLMKFCVRYSFQLTSSNFHVIARENQIEQITRQSKGKMADFQSKITLRKKDSNELLIKYINHISSFTNEYSIQTTTIVSKCYENLHVDSIIVILLPDFGESNIFRKRYMAPFISSYRSNSGYHSDF